MLREYMAHEDVVSFRSKEFLEEFSPISSALSALLGIVGAPPMVAGKWRLMG
jgi:hypothetical protein